RKKPKKTKTFSAPPAPPRDRADLLEATDGNTISLVGMEMEPSKGAGKIPDEISLDLERPNSSSSAPLSQATVQPARRKTESRTSRKRLVIWTRKTLEATSDPLGRGLLQILENTKTYAALFTSIQKPQGGLQVPTFLATAALGPSESLRF